MPANGCAPKLCCVVISSTVYRVRVCRYMGESLEGEAVEFEQLVSR